METGTQPTWQLTDLLGAPPALLRHEPPLGWSLVVDGAVVSGRSLHEAVRRGAWERTERRGPSA